MNILFVNGLHTGGTRVVVENVAREIRKNREVFLLCGVEEPGSPRLAVRDERTNRIPARMINVKGLRNMRVRRNYYNPSFNPLFRDFVKKVRPDLIHFHAIQPFGATIIEETLKLSIPFCITMHDWWWFCPRLYLTDINFEVCFQSGKIDPLLCFCVKKGGFEVKRYEYLRHILNRVRYILVPSRYTKNSIISQGIDGERIFISENGILPPGSFSRKPVTETVRFGFIGGGAGYKGFDVLVRALNRIQSGHCVVSLFNFQVLSGMQQKKTPGGQIKMIRHIAEKLMEEPYDKFHQLVRQVKNRKMIKSTAHCQIKFFPSFSNDELDDVFSNIDVLLVPSIMRETFSMVVREAMIRRIPVITSDCGGPEEIVRDGVNGYVFPTSDDKALADRMARIMSDPHLVEAFSRRIDTGKIVTVEAQAAGLESIYDRIISTWPAPGQS
jgi:glycosyltransferase involved in cell wall biosynthesis